MRTRTETARGELLAVRQDPRQVALLLHRQRVVFMPAQRRLALLLPGDARSIWQLGEM